MIYGTWPAISHCRGDFQSAERVPVPRESTGGAGSLLHLGIRWLIALGLFPVLFAWKMSVVSQAQFSMVVGTMSITLLLNLSSGLL